MGIFDKKKKTTTDVPYVTFEKCENIHKTHGGSILCDTLMQIHQYM